MREYTIAQAFPLKPITTHGAGVMVGVPEKGASVKLHPVLVTLGLYPLAPNLKR